MYSIHLRVNLLSNNVKYLNVETLVEDCLCKLGAVCGEIDDDDIQTRKLSRLGDCNLFLYQ